MNTSEWIKEVIDDPRPRAIPIMTHPGIELLGRRVVDAVTDGTIHFEAVRALNDRFPQAAACTTIMDLTVEAEAFGGEIHLPEDEVPSITGRLVTTHKEAMDLAVPGLDRGRIAEYLKADRLAAENIGKPVFAGCIGPFSLAGRLYGMTEIMTGIYIEPETVNLLLEKCTEFLEIYTQAIKQTGVAGVIMAEPAAGLLSNDDCAEYSSKYVKEIIASCQDDSFAVILHNCGNTGHCTGAMVSTGAKGYHFGNKADMAAVLEECPGDALVMGNLDPVGIFRESSPGQVADAVRGLLAATSGHPNFVLSSGCDTPPGVPFENIGAFYDAIG